MTKKIAWFFVDTLIVLAIALLIVEIVNRFYLIGMPGGLFAGQSENGQFIVDNAATMRRAQVLYGSIWIGASLLVGFIYVLAGELIWGTTPARRLARCFSSRI